MNRTRFADLLAEVADRAVPVDLVSPVEQGARRRRQRRTATVILSVLALVLAGVAIPLTGLPQRQDSLTTEAGPAAQERAAATPDVYDIAFLEAGGGETTVVSALRKDGTVREATTLPYRAGNPDLASDGRHLAWSSFGTGVVVFDLHDGTSRTFDVPVSADSAPNWSPDGTKIAIIDPGEDLSGPDYVGFFVIDVGTGKVHRAERTYRDRYLSWSPDGESLAVTVPEGPDGGREGIAIVRPNGSLIRLLEGPWSVGSAHIWSPSGDRLVILANTGPGALGASMVVSAASGAVLGTLPSNVSYSWIDDDTLRAVALSEPLVESWSLKPSPVMTSQTPLPSSFGAGASGGVAMRPAH